MRIGYVCHEYPTQCPGHGGIGSFTQTMARELVKRGHEVRVYGQGSGDDVSTDEGVEVLSFPDGPTLRRTFAIRRQLRAEMRRGIVDVIESPECTAHWLPGGTGTVVRMQGSHHFWCETLQQRRRPVRLLLEQVALRRAACLCAVSDYAASVTRDAMHLGTVPIETLYNPIDCQHFAPRPEHRQQNRVVFVGSVVEKKGIRELCVAMADVRRTFPQAELHVAGRDGPAPDGGDSFRTVVEQQLDDQTANAIHWLGAVDRHAVSELMSSAAVCVFPSYMETQGIVIAEALACGRPVLASACGPGPEVLGADGDCGYLVDPKRPADIAEKICRVLADPDQADAMGKRARLRAEAKFTVDRCVEQSMMLYERSLS